MTHLKFFPLSLAAALCLLLAAETESRAQIVYSVGTQEVYDSNIFLESNKSAATAPRAPDGSTFEASDGKLNADFISNPYVAAAGRLPTGAQLQSNFNVRLGTTLYANNNQENRFTVDGGLNFTNSEGVLPDYWKINLSENIDSQAGSIGVAQGASTQEAQINVVALSAGLSQYQLTGKDFFTSMVSISRQDFLGQFLYNSNTSDQQQKIQGIDSLTYAWNNQVEHKFNERWSATLGNNAQYYQVTGGETNNLGGNEGLSRPNRFEDSPSVGATYTPTERLRFTGQVGVDFSEYANSQDDRSISTIDESGTPTSQTIDGRSQSQSSLFYSGNSTYVVSDRASLGANVLQSAGTDLDGNRLLVRTVGVNGSYLFATSLSGTASFNFSQFNQGDTLNKPTDRYEAIASLHYALTDTFSVSVGYSFADQRAPDDAQNILFNNGDYVDHRAFVSLDTGFVALAK